MHTDNPTLTHSFIAERKNALPASTDSLGRMEPLLPLLLLPQLLCVDVPAFFLACSDSCREGR